MSDEIEIPDVKPSDLVARMSTALFLPGAFHKAECEQAAALLIHVCALNGDVWRGVKWSEVGDFVRPKLEKEEWRIFFNPFFRPDAHGLVERGYASFSDEDKQILHLKPLAILRAARSLGLLGGRSKLKEMDV